MPTLSSPGALPGGGAPAPRGAPVRGAACAKRRRPRVPREAWFKGLVSARNVKLSLILAVLGSLVATIAHGHLFTAFVFELFGDNKSVGVTESVAGIAALVTAIPVGVAVDKLPRTLLLRWCAVLGLLAAASGAIAVGVGTSMAASANGSSAHNGEPIRPDRTSTVLLLVHLVLWGVFFNTTSSASLALLADSIPKGARRREVFAFKSTITSVALATGPLITLARTGSSWSLEQMSYALMPGFLLMPLMSVLLLFFEEVKPPPEVSEPGKQADAEAGLRNGAATGVSKPAAGTEMVPYFLLMAELITSVGAGMTVKFFGLWFKNTYNFSPKDLALLQAATPVAIAVAVQALNKTAAASPCGPVPVMLVFWLVSIGCLLAMTCITDCRILVVLHLLRTALANCKEPLARAILADVIPSEKRGRWNAVHSLTGMTWTGSAALGGVLCDRYGYGQTFVVTAGLYLLAASCWIPLIKRVPKEPVEEEALSEGSDDDKLKGA